jgi:hypothetical protein
MAAAAPAAAAAPRVNPGALRRHKTLLDDGTFLIATNDAYHGTVWAIRSNRHPREKLRDMEATWCDPLQFVEYDENGEGPTFNDPLWLVAFSEGSPAVLKKCLEGWTAHIWETYEYVIARNSLAGMVDVKTPLFFHLIGRSVKNRTMYARMVNVMLDSVMKGGQQGNANPLEASDSHGYNILHRAALSGDVNLIGAIKRYTDGNGFSNVFDRMRSSRHVEYARDRLEYHPATPLDCLVQSHVDCALAKSKCHKEPAAFAYVIGALAYYVSSMTKRLLEGFEDFYKYDLADIEKVAKRIEFIDFTEDDMQDE